MSHGILEAKWKELKGKVKEQLGKISGSIELQQEGQAQRVHGKIQKAVADISKDKNVKKTAKGRQAIIGL